MRKMPLLIGIILEFCQGCEVVVLGDFNYPSLVWSAGDGIAIWRSKSKSKFLDCFAVSV